MIPFLTLSQIIIGPFKIYTWGLFVASGIFAALLITEKIAKEKKLDEQRLWRAAVWILAAAFAGARLAHVFFYDWHYYSLRPEEILMFWRGGFSSTGGFVGALLAAFVLFRRDLHVLRLYSEAVAFGFPLGLGIGRVGCFLNHMHPGKLTNFPLAVRYPDGARYDLGLYESALGFAIFGIFLLLRRLGKMKDFFALALIFLYALPRFFLDFLRASDLPMSDARYWGLTPAQYAMLGFMFLAIFLARGHRAVRGVDNLI